MEDERKKWGLGDGGFLPKIDKENKSNNVNHSAIYKPKKSKGL